MSFLFKKHYLFVIIIFIIEMSTIIKEKLITLYTKMIREYNEQNNGQNPYLEELLAPISDIRSSEKMLWTAHGHTATEIDGIFKIKENNEGTIAPKMAFKQAHEEYDKYI